MKTHGGGPRAGEARDWSDRRTGQATPRTAAAGPRVGPAPTPGPGRSQPCRHSGFLSRDDVQFGH